MISTRFFLVLFLLGISTIVSQQQQQQGATLTREAVDKLLEVLSFECRSEMEAALAQQSDISMECKIEIQQAIQEHRIPIQNAGPPPSDAILEDSEDEDGSDEQFEQNARANQQNDAKLKVKKEGGISPIYAILAFVVAFFGAAAAYVVQVNKSRANLPVLKPKKLSKKKEEKLKQKKEKMNQL